ncbi:ankyrin repeat domain-containing protein [Bdellovibrio sp.]|uniref:ankyrin repeat domain-containing protein n=1 Tax=Bdellovibrio sp. TaxID=28201 RepID=UPI0039E2EC6D
MKIYLKILSILALLSSTCLAKTSMEKTTSAAKVKAVLEAAETGDAEKFNTLLKDKTIDLNAQDETGMTPLMSAALGGNVDMVKKLLAKKVKLELKNQVGDTALAVALTNDQLDSAKVLINAGANVDLIVAGDNEDTLLMRAASNNADITALILKKNKGLINKTNKLGETALMQSIRFGNNDSVKMLLKAGADVKAKNKEGLSALDIAKKSSNEEAVKLLSAKK